MKMLYSLFSLPGCSDDRTQRKIPEVVVRQGKCTKERSEIINKLVLGVIVKGQRPFSMVEDSAFIDLLHYLEPGYACPGRTYFTKAVDVKYNEVVEKMSVMLAGAQYISITTDTWTSLATESYLTITVHYIDDKWSLISRILGTMLLEDRHTGQNLSQWILEMLTKFGVDPSKIVAVVHDNAANMVSAMQVLQQLHGWESIRCSAHTLQLAVNAALRVSDDIQNVLAKARKVVEHFNRSTVASGALEKQQLQMQLKPLALIQDVPTRWSSSYNMCNRLKELRLPVSMVLSNRQIIDNQKRSELELTTDEWSYIESLCDLLEPFALLTKFFEGQSYVSISSVQPLIKGTMIAMKVKPLDRPHVVMFKREATRQLETRFDDIFSIRPPNRQSRDNGCVSIAIRACAVDTRFHKLKSLNHEQPRIVRSFLETEMIKLATANTPDVQVTEGADDEPGYTTIHFTYSVVLSSCFVLKP